MFICFSFVLFLFVCLLVVCVCVCACVRACVRACVCVCVCLKKNYRPEEFRTSESERDTLNPIFQASIAALISIPTPCRVLTIFSGWDEFRSPPPHPTPSHPTPITHPSGHVLPGTMGKACQSLVCHGGGKSLKCDSTVSCFSWGQTTAAAATSIASWPQNDFGWQGVPANASKWTEVGGLAAWKMAFGARERK